MHVSISLDKLEVKWKKAQLIFSSNVDYAASSRTAIALWHCRIYSVPQTDYCMHNQHEKEVHHHKSVKLGGEEEVMEDIFSEFC